MYKRILSFTFVCIALVMMSNVQQAQAQNSLSIGYVDPQAILDRMPEMSAVEQRLQNFIDGLNEEALNKQAAYQEELIAYQQRSAVISDEARQEQEQRLGEMQAELQQLQVQYQQQVQQRQQELIGPLLQQVGTTINEVAEAQGLTYVLNVSTSNGDAIILYASPEAQQQYDITQQVMDRLGIE